MKMCKMRGCVRAFAVIEEELGRGLRRRARMNGIDGKELAGARAQIAPSI